MSQSELSKIVSRESVDASFDAMMMVAPMYELMARYQTEAALVQLCVYTLLL